MSDKPLSVVIPTYNRRARLELVLAGLERQLAPKDSFEVVVVDDGSKDDTTEWLQSRRVPFALRPIRLPNGGPARARNAGVEAATGKIILFIDDDVEPTESLVSEHLRSHERESDIVVIGPLSSLPEYSQPWVSWEQEKIEAQYVAMVRGDWEPTFRQFWTGNASVAKAHLVAVGGFNPEFLRAEDVELGVRLMEHGLKFRFNAAARGLHHAERSLDSWERVQSSYGRLEVDIFGRLGQAELLDLLSGNWGRLHPAIRFIVKASIERPPIGKATRTLLRGHLKLARWVPLPLMAGQSCSILANLQYWQASAVSLGPERAAAVFGSK